MKELKQALQTIGALKQQLDEANLLIKLQRASNIDLINGEQRLIRSLAEEVEKNRLVKSLWLFRFLYWKYYRKKFINHVNTSAKTK